MDSNHPEHSITKAVLALEGGAYETVKTHLGGVPWGCSRRDLVPGHYSGCNSNFIMVLDHVLSATVSGVSLDRKDKEK